MLPPLVGATSGKSGDRVGGYRVIRDSIARLGVDPDSVSVQTGSGGGRGDLVSARWLTQLLVALTKHPHFPVIQDALPAGGVDGTLRSAFRRVAFGKRVHAKTGTLTYASAIGHRWVHVSKSLAGYVDLGGRGDPDDLVAFAILLAGALAEERAEGSSRLVRAQEDIIEAVLEGTGLLPRP